MSFDYQHHASLLTEWADDAGESAPQFTADCRTMAAEFERLATARPVESLTKQRPTLLALLSEAADELAQSENVTLIGKDRNALAAKIRAAMKEQAA